MVVNTVDCWPSNFPWHHISFALHGGDGIAMKKRGIYSLEKISLLFKKDKNSFSETVATALRKIIFFFLKYGENVPLYKVLKIKE